VESRKGCEECDVVDVRIAFLARRDKHVGIPVPDVDRPNDDEGFVVVALHTLDQVRQALYGGVLIKADSGVAHED